VVTRKNPSPKKRSEKEIELINNYIKIKVPKTPDKAEFIKRNRSHKIPLSYAQQRVWFIVQYELESLVFNILVGFHIKGNLNVKALNQAFSEIIRRHESLRTTFSIIDGIPHQVISSEIPNKIPLVDLQHVTPINREHEAQHLFDANAQKPMDLTREVIRPLLIKVSPEEYWFQINVHHISTDGWSQSILFNELSVLYKAYTKEKSSPLPKLPIQFADFTFWQRDWLKGETIGNLLSYWSRKLKDIPHLALPTDHPRPTVQTYRGETQYFLIPKDLTNKLRELGYKNNSTNFIILLAAYKVLLMRYSGQEDICIGTPIAGRNKIEVENLIGLFVNTLVLRTDLSGNPSFYEIIERVRETTIDAYDHQDIPFEKLVAELNPDRDMSHTPLFQTMFAYQNTPESNLELEGLQLAPIAVPSKIVRYDLVLSILEISEGLSGYFRYNCDIFEKDTIKRLAKGFLRLLESIVNNPDQKIEILPLLNESETNQILFDWNNTSRDFPIDQCIHHLIEEQVELNPDAPAAIFRNQQLTYQELNILSNQFAHHLIKRGVGPEICVGICVERSIELVIGILGVLKAGGVYVPLDPKYPKERLAFIINDANISIVITQDHLISQLPKYETTVLCIDSDDDILNYECKDNPTRKLNSNNLAYIIYTSGSTGDPKGVAIKHRSLVSNLIWSNNHLFHEKRVLIPAVIDIAFDPSLKQLLSPLLRGERVWILPNDVSSDPFEFYKLLNTVEKKGINCVPSMWMALLDVFELNEFKSQNGSISYLFTGAEIFPKQLIDRTFALFPEIEIWNLYGPTESTISVTAAKIEADSIITIGNPIANTQIYILNNNLQPVPIGVSGNIFIGGEGLARGYQNNPALTAEKFIPNPFGCFQGSRLYSTGDRARWQSDGNIVFLGRLDHQVKIRGFRIEIGEIEAALFNMPGVQDVVVVTNEDPLTGKELGAYIVPNKNFEITTEDAKLYLKNILPKYMIPSKIIFLDKLPLSTIGKIDRNGLPGFAQTRSESNIPYTPPQSNVERVLTGLWVEVLHIERVGIHDNFFNLGGHSLLATMLVSRIRKVFPFDLSLQNFFQGPTIEDLTQFLITNESHPGEVNEIAKIFLHIKTLTDEELKSVKQHKYEVHS